MKMKRFLMSVIFFCTAQMPCIASATTAIDGFATELFTYDTKLAPIKLEFVDFKIDRNRTVEEYGKNIGKYNFKLFGCKRAEKNIVLNQGRAMRRDMKFGNVFFEEMNELFPVVVNKDSPYYPYSIGDKLPGYLITAEIKDLYVNVCDHYDWRTRLYSQLRSGSAEIKVKWRVMTPYNRKLYWEGTTHGYATIQDPIRNGEIRLVEKAFGDALVRLIGMPGFLQTMYEKPDARMLAQAKADFDNLVYQHIRKRNKLQSSYRRKRMKFYSERERIRELENLEKLGPAETQMGGPIEHALPQKLWNKMTPSQREDWNGMTPAQREKWNKMTPAQREEWNKMTPDQREEWLRGRAGKLLSDNDQIRLGAEQEMLRSSMSYGDGGKLLTEGQQGLSGRLLSSDRMNHTIYGRLLTSVPLYNIFDELFLTSSMDREAKNSILNGDLDRLAKKYGFIVSGVDGWITINNIKPFRFLSPVRLYRIRASVVAVTTDSEVGSGLVIAPSLVLTNYSVTKSSPYIKVEFLDGRVVPSMVLRVNKEKDVALVYMPPAETWPVPLRVDLPDIGEDFFAIGTPMRGGFEGAMEEGKVAGYRYTNEGVEILTNTNVQSVTLGGVLVDKHGNAIGLAHAGESLLDSRRDGFIPIGDAFDALKVRIRDRFMDETPTQKALRLKKSRDNYIK